MMSASVIAVSALAMAIVSIVLYNPTDTTSFLLAPPNVPGSHDVLQFANVVPLPGSLGPESVAFDKNGDGPYAGVADGRILKWDGEKWTDFAFTSSRREECVRPFAPELEHVCGRPLGLRFDKKSGDLYIADAYLGLHVVGPNGGLATRLVGEVEGRPLLFTNDVDIDAEEDVIYFTDTSTIFQRRQFLPSILSGDKTGRLLKYDRSNKEVTVLLQGLAFANGVALSKDLSFIVVAETSSCSLIRYWLRGPNAGKSEIFAELPGFPDNVRRNSNGEFWVALHSKRSLFVKWVTLNPWLGKTLLKLPLNIKQLHALLAGGEAHATAVKLSEEGKVLEVLEDTKGKTLKFISEVEEKNGKLWIGSVLMPFMGVYNLS